MKAIRILLLILILIGIGLLCTQTMWVPRLVDHIIASQGGPVVVPVTPEPVHTSTGCTTNSDCAKGDSCVVYGPLIANQPPRKMCVSPGQAVPL